MKRVLRLARPDQYNSGAGRLFRRAVPGSNAAASVFCGWRHQEQCDNQTAAQPERKAGFVVNLYTAKRMIQFLHLLDIKLEIIKLKLQSVL